MVSFQRLLWLVFLIQATTIWLFAEFGQIAIVGAVLVPVGSAILAFLRRAVGDDKAVEIERKLLLRGTSARALLVGSAGLLLVVLVVNRIVVPDAGIATIRITSLVGPDIVQQPQNGTTAFILNVPFLPRVLSVDGYEPKTVVPYPVVPQAVVLARDLTPIPTVFVRLPLASHMYLNGATAAIAVDGHDYASVPMADASAVLRIGTKRDLPLDETGRWRAELVARQIDPRTSDRALAMWSRFTDVNAPVALRHNKRLTVVLRARSGQKVAEGSINLPRLHSCVLTLTPVTQ